MLSPIRRSKKIQNSQEVQKRLNFFLGDFLDLESALLLKKLAQKYGNYLFLSEKKKNMYNNVDFKNFYLSTCDLSQLKKMKFIFMVNTNLRFLLPLINIKIKNLVSKTRLQIFTIGENVNLTYSHVNLGKNLNSLVLLMNGKHEYS